MVKSVIGGEAELADAIENASYRKIHVKFTLDPEKLEIYLGNEINWLRQKFRKYFTGLDQHDLNRLESVTSAEIMRNIESQLQEIMGTEFKILVGNERSNPRSSSIHTALTEDEVDETRVENSHLADIDIESHELSRDEIKELFGDNANILAAFSYPGDGHIPMEYHAQVREAVTKLGQQWMEPSEVKKIFLYNKDGKLALAGALIEEGGERNFIPADKMHFTGGYMSELFYGSEIDGVKVLSNPTTVATGVSINAILKRTPEINKFIKEFGSTGQIAVTNSHWTLLAKGDDEVIIRITGGGNTGSEEYNPNYFLNVIANTNKIFQDALIGVIRSYGCPRSINSINSTQFEKIAEGLLVSYGKGGTGNTKRFAEAVIGLDALGYGEEVAEYFSQFKNYAGENMGAVIKDMCKTFKKESAFFIDSTRKTKEALMPFGYSSFLENFSSRFAASAFTERGQDAPTQFPSKLISHSPEKARAKALQERQREGASK